MSVRKNIIDALETGFKTILISNGYRTDIGSTVYQWKTTAINQDETQSLILKDTNNGIVESNHINHEHLLNVEIGVFYSGTDPVSNVRDAMLDVYEWIGRDENMYLGGNSYQIEYKGDQMESEHPEQVTADGLINIEVSYITQAFKPDVIGYTR